MTQIAVITGASAGIGAAAARNLTAQGWHVHGTGRSQAKLDAVAASCEPGSFTGHVADFASLAQVRGLAAELASLPQIDVLANNAGGTWPERHETEDGHELTHQANHLAPFLLTHLLADRLRGGRVIATSSIAHRFARLNVDDMDWTERRYFEAFVYGTSKLCNLLFAAELQRRSGSDLLSTSFHPGPVRSEFGRDTAVARWFYSTPLSKPVTLTNEQGADTLVYLATAPREALVPGAYYVRRKVHTPSKAGRDTARAAALWDETTKTLGL